MKNIQKYRTELQNNGILFSIAGVVSQDMLVILIQSLKDKIDLLLEINPKAHNLFNIFIEQAQNVINYSTNYHTEINKIINTSSILLVGYDSEKGLFYTSSSNLVKNKDVDVLKTKIDYINSLTYDEMKLYYRQMRKSGDKLHEKGAGLGLIEMAKRSSEKLIYSFEPYDEMHQFFILKIYS